MKTFTNPRYNVRGESRSWDVLQNAPTIFQAIKRKKIESKINKNGKEKTKYTDYIMVSWDWFEGKKIAGKPHDLKIGITPVSCRFSLKPIH